MNLERMLRKEGRKRLENELRRERVNRNWPLHAQRVVDVFREVQDKGRKHGVALFVSEPELFHHANGGLGLRIGEIPLGVSTVILSFVIQLTGTGVLTRTTEGEREEWDHETGAQLVVHHSFAEGLVQVFFVPPQLDKTTESESSVLFTHTYNTDDVTREWVANLVSSFFVFNRVESVLELPSLLDRLRVRWWRFMDIRNRRGYLDKLQHVLTPWELMLITALGAIVLAKL